MASLVMMLIVCWHMGDDGDLHEIWRIEHTATVKHCLTMNQVISGAGPKTAIIVKCTPESPS